MNLSRVLFLAALIGSAAAGQDLNCDLNSYKAQDGLKARLSQGSLELTWNGERNEQLRATFTIRAGQPVIQELAAKKNGAGWLILGQNLTPEYELTSGVRRLSQQQMSPLQDLKVQLNSGGCET